MKRALRTYGVYAALIVTFALVAVVVGVYIVIHQRLQLPLQSRYTLKAAFPTSNALTPGLGQPANVAGVKVGVISGSELHNGYSIVTMSIDPSRLPHVYANGTATLFPNTPLLDMEINIAPGSPPARVLKPGEMIPLAQSNAPFQSDDLLNALDADTRQYFTALIADLGTGLRGRGADLRALFRNLGPTSGQVHELTRALAARRVALERVVHNLSVLAVATAAKDAQLGTVVEAANRTLGAIASQNSALSQSIALLPGTLSAAQRTLGHTTPFANELGATLTALQPATHILPQALRSGGTLLNAAEPVLRKDVAPFVKASIPVLSDLGPATTLLTAETPDFSNVSQVLQYLANELLYNAGGAQHSYIYWLDWFTHNVASDLSTQDAYGSGVRGILQLSCATFDSFQPGLQALTALLVNVHVC